MKTYNDEAAAHEAMRLKNLVRRAAGNTKETAVVVEGPEDGTWTVMEIGEAIESGFGYTWA
jgi:hypothetical protein